MKVVIVAAGRGSRLDGVSSSKPLVQLSGKPLLQHVIETVVRAFSADKNVEISVVTGWHHQKIDALISALNRQLPVQVTTIHNENWQKGNGKSVLSARDAVDEPFLLLMADHIVEPQILQTLQAGSLQDADVLLGVDYKLSNPLVDLDDVTRVQCDEQYITAIGKHLKPYDGFDTGCFLCSPVLFEALSVAQKRFGDYGISGGVQILAEKRRVCAVDIGQAKWIDVDTPEMLKLAEGLI